MEARCKKNPDLEKTNIGGDGGGGRRTDLKPTSAMRRTSVVDDGATWCVGVSTSDGVVVRDERWNQWTGMMVVDSFNGDLVRPQSAASSSSTTVGGFFLIETEIWFDHCRRLLPHRETDHRPWQLTDLARALIFDEAVDGRRTGSDLNQSFERIQRFVTVDGGGSRRALGFCDRSALKGSG
ncbi:hypothetical protein U1Q18_009451 [Sarracenia purpurea var. burkii]